MEKIPSLKKATESYLGREAAQVNLQQIVYGIQKKKYGSAIQTLR